LNVLASGPVLAIYQPESVLAAMDDWNQKQHGSSGLLVRVRASSVSAAEAEARTLEFLSPWVPPGASPMCGNSICQDRRFLAREMPALERFFHYRNLDVSTLKELARRWAPHVADSFVKEARIWRCRHPRIHPRAQTLPGSALRCRLPRALNFLVRRGVGGVARNIHVSITESGFKERLRCPARRASAQARVIRGP